MALVVVPSFLVVPAPAAQATPVAVEAEVRVAKAVTVTDIAARARRVIGLANRHRWAELGTIATPEMVAFLQARG